jgi:hypothetical protein
MVRPLLELLVEARIADDRERALSSFPRKPRRQHGLFLRHRHNSDRGHAARSPEYGRLATTHRC